MFPMQRCFSDLVCQPLVTSYVIDAYLCLAVLHAWTLEYQQYPLSDGGCLQRQKANGQLEKTAGPSLHRLAQQCPGGCQRSTTAIYLCCGDLRSPGVTERCNGPLRLCDDDDLMQVTAD